MYNPGIDKIVLGTAGLGGVWGAVKAEESVATIVHALACGIRSLDTAPAYGDAELFVGEALAQWAGEKPSISTKVGRLKSYRADQAYYDYTLDGMKKSIENSLQTLGVSTIDVLFLHDPGAIAVHEIENVVFQMQEFKKQGYAREIGIGGNTPEAFAPFLEHDIFDVIMEYNRLNACCMEALHTTIPICERTNKTYYAASPLNMGLLGCNFETFTVSPPDWLDSERIEQAKKINTIAERYGLALDALALRFLYTVPASFKMVLGAGDKNQLKKSLDAIEAGLLPANMYNEILQTLN